MHSDLKILDPIWTTAYIVRNHGYMIYDTLFAIDANREIKPQMVDKYDVSADKLTYTFTLRDGLEFHDGQPVTAEDCVASIKRWAAQRRRGPEAHDLRRRPSTVEDPRPSSMQLKEPTGLVLPALGKPTSNVPFMMPKRVAETDPNTQITDSTARARSSSRRDEWKPGDKTVYVRIPTYKPRAEPASRPGRRQDRQGRPRRMARASPTTSRPMNALLAGEIDFIEAPQHDLLPLLEADRTSSSSTCNPLGNQYIFRFNQLHKPFDNPEDPPGAAGTPSTRRTSSTAVIGDPNYYKVCKALFICGTPLASDKGMEGLLKSNFDKAQELLKEAGYDGTPVVLHALDRPARADQPGAGGQAADGEGRLQGRHAVDGLADARHRAAAQEGPAGRRAAGTPS